MLKKTARPRKLHVAVPESSGPGMTIQELESQLRTLRLELEQARERSTLQYDHAPVGYCTLDAAGRIHTLNHAAEALLGRQCHAIAGSLFSSLIKERSQLSKLSAHLRACSENSARVVTRLRLRHADGAALFVQLTSQPEAGRFGTVYLTALTDLTEQAATERTLKRNQARLKRLNHELEARVHTETEALKKSEIFKRAAFESIAAQLLIVDLNGEILAINASGADTAFPAMFAVEPPSSNYLETCRRAAEDAQDGAAQAAIGISAVLAGNLQQFRTEYRRPGERGEDRWFSLSVTALAQGAGAVLLHEDISERKHLEREILEISELERRNIGQDLHDGLCQYLTGTALMATALANSLGATSESEKARDIAQFMRAAVEKTRELARGLHPVEIEGCGLVGALQELAQGINKRVPCVFQSTRGINVKDAMVAVTYYRIAQEAVENALKHGNPRKILITLSNSGAYLVLTVEDDGIGFHPQSMLRGKGMGINIMKYRASALGAKFAASNLPARGVRVLCSLPLANRRIGKSFQEPSGLSRLSP
ncbi:MAG: PAS domain S-box protein, partial [Verrucomicrobiota bacterium]